LHHQLEAVRAKRGGDLAIVVLPVPLNSGCNKYAAPALSGPHKESCVLAKLALAVWRADRTKFAAFHHWLFETDQPRAAADARTRAKELIGDEAFYREYDGLDVPGMVGDYVEIYGAQKKGLPLLLIESAVIYARFASEDQLAKVLDEEFAPPAQR
jgi:hypothetical protein